MSVYICESVNLNGEASDEASPFSFCTGHGDQLKVQVRPTQGRTSALYHSNLF